MDLIEMQATVIDKSELVCHMLSVDDSFVGSYKLLVGIENNSQMFQVPHDLLIIKQPVVSSI